VNKIDMPGQNCRGRAEAVNAFLDAPL
jgi:hypothetical protein